jgi:hypothetical protein
MEWFANLMNKDQSECEDSLAESLPVRGSGSAHGEYCRDTDLDEDLH